MKTFAAAPPALLPRLAVPAVLAFIQVVGTVQAAQDQPDRDPVDALAVVLLLAGPSAIGALRRRVVPMAAAVLAVTLLYVGLGYPYGPVFVSVAVALFLVVRDGHRQAGWALAGSGFVAAVAADVWLGPESTQSWLHAAAVAGWLIAVLVVADIVRVRSERAAELQRAAEETARRHASEERLRIAQELHDVLAHNISLISVQAGVGLHLMDEQPDQAREALVAIRQASKDALGELRGVLDLLRGSDDAPRSPVAGLDQLDRVVANAAAAGLDVEVETVGVTRELPPEVDLAALRITQEALTNVARHAGASRARVCLTYEPGELLVTVDDDGRGSPVGALPSSGNGIIGMRERAVALGGRLDAGPGPAGGFRVTARLPTASQQR